MRGSLRRPTKAYFDSTLQERRREQRSRWAFFNSLLIVVYLGGAGCVAPPPDEEMAIAEAAFSAAKEAKGDQLASEWYQKAEDELSRARRARNAKEFDLAKKLALRARNFAEKAEEISVLKTEKGGSE